LKDRPANKAKYSQIKAKYRFDCADLAIVRLNPLDWSRDIKNRHL